MLEQNCAYTQRNKHMHSNRGFINLGRNIVNKYRSTRTQDKTKKTAYKLTHTTKTTRMKIIDIDNYDIIKAGKEYISESSVNIQQLLGIMEKNETFIFWLQPKNGDINSQLACIKINGVYYNLNLKMEKVIFRHIRLTKNFINQEKLEDGTPKLRIPQRLLKEKLRTALRAQQV